MVIPPIFTAKADYRSIAQHALQYFQDFTGSCLKMNLRQIAPWLLLVAIALIYLAFPTRVYYWDGIVFAQTIEDAVSMSPSLVHPNHLIYNFAGYGFYKLLLALGFHLRALTALQILNCLLSAACAGMFLSILRHTFRSVYLCICLTLLFAFTATWWKFSTDANAYIPSVLFLLVSFYLILPDRKARPFLVGLTFFVAMAFHQLAVLMFPVLALGVYLQDGPLLIKRRLLNVVYFSAVAIVLIVTTYGYLFYLASGTFDVARLIRWTASFSPDAETGFNWWSNLQYSLRGQVRLFFGGRFNLLKGITNPFVIVLMIALGSAVIFLMIQLIRNSRRILHFRGMRGLQLTTHQKTVLLLSLVWAAIYLLFLYFWLPQNTFYRVFYLPAFILLFGLVISALRYERPRWITAAFVVAVALANFLFLIYPFSHVQKYPPLAFALEMNREWPPGTVIYYGAKNSDEALVRYFNPSTRWRHMAFTSLYALNEEIADLRSTGVTVWLETTAIDQLTSTYAGTQWLERRSHAESWRELADKSYRIRFVQVRATLIIPFGKEQLLFLPRDAETGYAKRQVHKSQKPTFRAEHTAKHAVQRRHIDVVLALSFEAGPLHQLSPYKDWQKEREVRVGGALDFKSGLLEHAPQFRQTVSTPVMAHVVLKSPQKHKRRYEQQSSTARSQHAMHLAQTSEVVVHVFDDIKRSYEIKRAVIVR